MCGVCSEDKVAPRMRRSGNESPLINLTMASRMLRALCQIILIARAHSSSSAGGIRASRRRLWTRHHPNILRITKQ